MSKTTPSLSDQELDIALGKLRPQLQPDNDLWPGIAAQLPRQRLPWWQQPSAIAASFIGAVLCLGLAVVSQLENQQLRHSLATATMPTLQQAPVSTLPVAFNHQQQATLSCLEPNQAQIIEQNLAIIQSAMNDIHMALEKSPNNTKLNQRLLDLSKQQINLVNRANTLTL